LGEISFGGPQVRLV